MLAIYFHPIFHYSESELLYHKRIELVSFHSFVLLWEQKGSPGNGRHQSLYFPVCSSWPGKRDWKGWEIRPVLSISIAGVPVGCRTRRIRPEFSDKLHLWSRQTASRSLRSHSELLNPPQTTGPMMACGGSESFISLLFSTYLASRNQKKIYS